MTKESNPNKKNKETDTKQEDILQDQYEFGLNEEVRKDLEKDEDDHKESDNVADEDDVVIDDN